MSGPLSLQKLWSFVRPPHWSTSVVGRLFDRTRFRLAKLIYDGFLIVMARDQSWQEPLLTSLAPQPGNRILDFGPQSASTAAIFARRFPEATFVGMDPNPKTVKKATQRVARRRNALLAEVAWTADRVVLIEDTRELQCKAPNLVALRTKDGVASLSDLVRSSLRLRPDRIPIGEVRGAEALDLLKAWGTGHPGGIGTIHAGSAIGALRRLEQLIQEAVVTVPRALIAETINLIAVPAGRGAERKLVELAVVKGLDGGGDYVLVPAVKRTSKGGRS